MNGFIDSHFHLLAVEQKGINIATLLKELKDSGFEGGIDIGLSADDLPQRLKLSAMYPEILHASAIGPWGAALKEDISKIVSDFTNFVSDYSYQFIGEIGLDYHWNYGTKERQKELFVSQIELANSLNKPIIVHSRDADEDTKAILDTQNFKKRGIMHCFSSTEILLKSALDKDFFISFAGPVTYKSSGALRQMVSYVPLENLLLETDSPYLSPEPLRGKVNTPLNISFVYEEVSKIKNIPLDKLIEQIKSNFKLLSN